MLNQFSDVIWRYILYANVICNIENQSKIANKPLMELVTRLVFHNVCHQAHCTPCGQLHAKYNDEFNKNDNEILLMLKFFYGFTQTNIAIFSSLYEDIEVSWTCFCLLKVIYICIYIYNIYIIYYI